MIRKLRATPTAMGTKKFKSVSRKHSSADRQTDRKDTDRRLVFFKERLRWSWSTSALRNEIRTEMEWPVIQIIQHTHAPKVRQAIRRGIVRHFGSDPRRWMLRLQLFSHFLRLPCVNGINVTKYQTILWQRKSVASKTKEKHVYTVGEKQPLAFRTEQIKQVELERLVTSCHVSLSPDEIGQHNH